MKPVIGTEGGKARIECKAYGDPVPDVMWKKVDTNQAYPEGNFDEVSFYTPV